MARRQETRLDRRQFLKAMAAAGAGAILTACGVDTVTVLPETETALPSTATPRPTATTQAQIATTAPTEEPASSPTPQPTPELAYLAVARGADPAAITMAAIAAIGGIARFVKQGDDVIIKPNICTNYYSYEYGATTNPEVVATLVRMCLGAGAKRVRVMDHPFGGTSESAYGKSGIAEAVAAAGGEMEIMNRNKFKNAAIPEGRDIKEWTFYKPILDADVVIDVPIAKHHNLARLSLAGKNLLGVITNPGGIHANLGQRIADLVSVVRPTLTVVDAVRTLMRNGPTGGNLDDVRLTNTVIASHDIVAADAYAATLFDLTGSDIAYIKASADMGLGTLDLRSIKIEEIAV